MAKHLSKLAQISFGGTAIGQIRSLSWSENDSQIDVTDFDSSVREFVNVGLVDREATMEVHWDLGEAGQDLIRAAIGSTASEVIIYPEGNTSGKPTLTADAIVMSHEISAAGIEDVLTGTFTVKFTEAFTEGTVA